jgi:hypothetical protein
MPSEDGKRINIGVRLLPGTITALDAAGVRMGGKSRAFVIEVLTAIHAGNLDAATSVPVGMVPSDSRAKKKPAGKGSGKK